MTKQTSLLLVDDEELNLISLKAFFVDQGYTVEIAENGKIALELYDRQRQNNEPFDLVITDLRMPVMSGQELIAHLLTYERPPLILIQSVVDDVSQVVDLMKKGVYDYLLKPYHLDELEHRIKNAIDFASLSKVKRNLEHDRDLRLDQQLKWNRWRDQLFVKKQIKSDSTIVHNIRTSFTQGGGFGVLLSLLQIIEQQAQKTEGGYLVDNDLMDMIFTNAKTASSVIEKLVEIDSVYDTQFTDESISAF
ncbi:MAG: response regulator, partial [Leptonema sp. (in: Bacteria)]|nr:response regulator [Leptonema sp. (in: bacteria)]